MTHTNHRMGSRESLLGDWVVFAYGTGAVDDYGKHKKLLEILTRHDPVCCKLSPAARDGDKRTLRYVKGWDKRHNSGLHESVTLEYIKSVEGPRGDYYAVYDNKEAAQNVIKDLAEADLGFSVVVSGIFDETFNMCEKAGIRAHTVNMSGGIIGKTSLLPELKILEFTTMCGHHFVSRYLVSDLLERVRRGQMRKEDAAVEMAKQCTCSIFNVERANRLIEDYIEASKQTNDRGMVL